MPRRHREPGPSRSRTLRRERNPRPPRRPRWCPCGAPGSFPRSPWCGVNRGVHRLEIQAGADGAGADGFTVMPYCPSLQRPGARHAQEPRLGCGRRRCAIPLPSAARLGNVDDAPEPRRLHGGQDRLRAQDRRLEIDRRDLIQALGRRIFQARRVDDPRIGCRAALPRAPPPPAQAPRGLPQGRGNRLEIGVEGVVLTARPRRGTWTSSPSLVMTAGDGGADITAAARDQCEVGHGSRLVRDGVVNEVPDERALGRSRSSAIWATRPRAARARKSRASDPPARASRQQGGDGAGGVDGDVAARLLVHDFGEQAQRLHIVPSSPFSAPISSRRARADHLGGGDGARSPAYWALRARWSSTISSASARRLSAERRRCARVGRALFSTVPYELASDPPAGPPPRHPWWFLGALILMERVELALGVKPCSIMVIRMAF